jgi:hypothetical protein
MGGVPQGLDDPDYTDLTDSRQDGPDRGAVAPSLCVIKDIIKQSKPDAQFVSVRVGQLPQTTHFGHSRQ